MAKYKPSYGLMPEVRLRPLNADQNEVGAILSVSLITFRENFSKPLDSGSDPQYNRGTGRGAKPIQHPQGGVRPTRVRKTLSNLPPRAEVILRGIQMWGSSRGALGTPRLV